MYNIIGQVKNEIQATIRIGHRGLIFFGNFVHIAVKRAVSMTNWFDWRLIRAGS